MVSKKRAGPRNRNLQLRNQYRRNSYTTHRPVDRGTPWLALGISADWRSGICLAGCVVVAIPKTRTTFLLLQSRKSVHTERSRGADPQNKMGAASAAQTNLGVCRREIHDRPHLVVLSLLDSRLPAATARSASDTDRVAHRGHLCDFRPGKYCRRMAIIQPDPAAFFN